MDNIKYIFIGNLNSKKEIVDYPPNVNKNIVDDSKSIFDKFTKQKSYKYDERIKIVSSFGVFHFTIYASNTFYLILANPNYAEKDVYELINDFHDKEIFRLVNEKGEISTQGKSQFNSILEKKKNSAMDRTKAALEDVNIEIRKGINNAMRNVEDVQELEEKAKNIENAANIMLDQAHKLSWCSWLQNFKWTLIIVSIVIAVLIVIIVPVAVTLTNEAKEKEKAAMAAMGVTTNITNVIITKP